MQLFSRILDLLFPRRDTELVVADATPASIGVYVSSVQLASDTVSLLPYRAHLVKALVVEAKFRDNERAQRLLGGVLAKHLLELSADKGVLIPVPLSKERLKERGYNQTERIVLHALTALPEVRLDTDILVRTRHTDPQTSLSGSARRTNLVGAFCASRPADPDHTYIIVDDVCTTGSTLEAARAALQSAGATRIYALSLAH